MSDVQLSRRPITTDAYARHVVARLLDFFADTTPWPRRLWEVSSLLALREAVEAGGWVDARVLSDKALRWYLHALERQLGPDKGLGESRLRKELVTLLRSGVSGNSRERRRLEQLLPLASGGYLRRWASCVDSEEPPSPERLARALATHLLDLGHSSGALHRWTTALTADPAVALADLLVSAQNLADQPDRCFEVAVPFVSVPDGPKLAHHLTEWRSPADTSAWLHEQGIDPLPRHNGAFVYQITAKDVAGAVRIAAANIDRIQARRSYARGAHRRLQPVGKAWVAGHGGPYLLDPAGRGAIVLALETEATMYLAAANERLDEALELAAPVNGGPTSSAVTGSWAAIESLLSHPGDAADVEEGKVVGADRLAAITACSWPRAELTALSHRHQPDTADAVTRDLSACADNRERSAVIAVALHDGRELSLRRSTDQAAQARMVKLLADPNRQLRDVQAVFIGVFRRLYRQRNIVVHGGSTAAVALRPSLRTAAPLLGAGLDRLVHAQLTNGVTPLNLAARAENSLALIGDHLGPSVTDLLESVGP